MKKIYIILLLILSFISNAQQEQPVTIKEKSEPIMLVCSNVERTKWFSILPTFKKFNGITEKNYLTTVKLNIGKCSNRDLLIFTFIDGKSMTFRSNLELNCNGIIEVTFPLNPIQLGVLEMKSVKSIRYVNGNDRSSFLYKLTSTDNDFFKNLL